MQDLVLIINQNDNQTLAIARALRAEQIYAKVVDAHITLEEIMKEEPNGLIVSGSMAGREKATIDKTWLKAGLPLLSLGDSALKLCEELGGSISEDAPFSGIHPITIHAGNLIKEDIACDHFLHDTLGLCLSDAMQPMVTVADKHIGFSHASMPLFGLQLHVEQNDMEAAQILANFAIDVCLCTRWWDSDAIIKRALGRIKNRVTTGTALLELTGGVDTGVCAMLSHMALGDELQCYIVDTGLSHPTYLEQTVAFLRDEAGLNVEVVDAKARFAAALKGLQDKGEKAFEIMKLYDEIRLEQKQRTNAAWLLRATNCADRLQGTPEESDPAFNTHVYEPIAQLFKDEVRHLAQTLGFPQQIYTRQPFPETGFALRIAGEVNAENVAAISACDDIFKFELEQSGQNKKLWQYFAMLMPLDNRYLIVMRAVHLVEGTGAYAARLPFDLMERVTDRILTEVPRVARVMYDFTPSPCSQDVEWP